MNICLFSIKVPILVKICPTVIEILTVNKWSQKFTVSRTVISYLQSMELTDVIIDAIVALAKEKQTKWCLVRKILLWSPYVIGQTIIFSSCFFLLSSSSFFSSPNLSGRRLDVYHTLAHGVALVRI